MMSDQMISRWVAIDDMEIHRVNRKAREVTAYATFFAQPTEIRDKHGHYWEEINRAAFNRTLSHGFGRVQVFYNHGYDLTGRPNMLGAVPIATPSNIAPDGRGLLTVSRYNDGELADHVLAAWEGGQIRGQSFSGKVYQDKTKGQRGGLDHIERTELGLREFGPTYSPAYEGDGLVLMRAELEDVLRSMLPSLITPAGTPSLAPSAGDSTTSATPTGPGAEDEDSGKAHSSRNRNVARARAARIKLEGQNGQAS
jgi:HK97 family phage prohead protease